MVQTVGCDLGSQKTVIVADDADLVLTSTGGISRPTLIAFFGRTRLVGEGAAPQISGDAAVPMLNTLLGRSEKDISANHYSRHRKVAIRPDDAGRLVADVQYCDETKTMHVTSMLGMFLSKEIDRVKEVYPQPDLRFAFAVPPNSTPSTKRAILEACSIAGMDLSTVSIVDAADGLVAAYTRKLAALKGNDRTNLESKRVLLVEMGHTQSTVVVADIGAFDSNPSVGPSVQKVVVEHDHDLGALHFDLKLFDHFAVICAQKNGGETIVPGSKRGQRLLLGCERIRKLLSQLPESSITVENMTDAGDVSFTLKREDLSKLCADLLQRFKALLTKALTAAGGAEGIAAVEVLGGGVRMQVVQAIVQQVVGEQLPLGAKLDDASCALGAAMLANQLRQQASSSSSTAAAGDAGAAVEEAKGLAVPSDENSVGLTPAEVAAARAEEIAMQARDAEITLLLAARNELESYLLEMRAVPRRKHGDIVDAAALNALLDDNETWLWDTPDASLKELNDRFDGLKTAVTALCKVFFEKTEVDRVMVEEALSAEAKRAAEERAANGEDDEDNDNRKLKKPDRMRLVVKNKEEGTELFKGGNFRPAAARYHKSLSHAAKFFDLGPEDEKEVKNIKTLLYLNLASCYIKLENWDQVIRNCDFALELDPVNPKAFFRRSAAYEAKRDFDLALADARKAQELNDVEDKLVTKAMDRIKKEIQKEKDKEKKMWGNAFKK